MVGGKNDRGGRDKPGHPGGVVCLSMTGIRSNPALSNPALLEVENIETCYGRSQVLFGVSLAIAAGGMVSLLGPHGMGQTATAMPITRSTPSSAVTGPLAGAGIPSPATD